MDNIQINSHFIIILSILILSGVLGGTIGFFRENTKIKENRNDLIRSIFLGIGASLLVPLLLKMISSDLLKTSKENDLDYFVIIGFCLVASVFSSKFIMSIGEKVLSQVKDVKDDLSNVKNEVEKITTEDESNETDELVQLSNFSNLENNDREVLLALNDSKYRFRSVSGIKNDTSLNNSQIKSILGKLKGLEYVIEKEGSKGIRWEISELGIKYLKAYYNDNPTKKD
jgi:hypothetical protein